MDADSVDAIVIGSGQGGVPFAVDLAKEGKRVVLFERGRLGGSCVNYGCTPSKAFLASAHGAGRARLAARLGVNAAVSVDFGAVMTRVRRIRDEFTEGVDEKLRDAGVHVVHAEASFSGRRTVNGGATTITAKLVVIDTGTSARVPDIPGLAGTPYLTNANFFELTELPKTALVLGGGYIGLELGQGLARCGASVHVIDGNSRVLSREESDASEALQKGLSEDGLRLHLGSEVSRVDHDGSMFSLTLENGEILRGDALLVAVGREPNTKALRCPSGGVELDAKGYIAIDDHFRTSAEGVFAIGDVAGQPAFTHVSWEDYRRLRAILRGEERTRSDRVLAYTTFTEPQVARAGMTLEQAKGRGLRARSVTLPMSKIARAMEWGHEIGFYRLVVDDESEKILGATLVGYEAGEVIHVIVAHMQAGSSWRVLDASVHIHPTYAEALPSLARLLN
ncbi:MAG TPA: FAD-dependent oxidoreductase [Candidatus Eremiobacteraceae bacterium]|nr:FAD-dependent oxidoreductase [Candidatus Eremiobacteraceae bacterium]